MPKPKEFYEGAKAFRTNLSGEETCPYCFSSDESEYWLDGWDKAQDLHLAEIMGLENLTPEQFDDLLDEPDFA